MRMGYLNILTRDELGREMRTVEIDPVRAPLVEWAFKAYASGNWTLSQLHDELEARGLVTVPSPRRPAKPPVLSAIHRMLTNPYYKGDVIYRGVQYKGAHEPLIPAEVWYQVQSVLIANRNSGESTQTHSLYLKGTIYCGECGSRLIVSNAKNRYGNVYPYFVCAGRHTKRTNCTRQAILIEDVDRLVEEYYERVQITPAHRATLAGMLHHELDLMMAGEAYELEELTKNRDRIIAQQDKLLQAFYADAITLAHLKREQQTLASELHQVEQRLTSHHSEYSEARENLDDSLDLLENCADIYRNCDDANRRLCNQAFFTRIFIDEDNTLHVENERPYEVLLDPEVSANALNWAAGADEARTVPFVEMGQSSNLATWVPQIGIEPTTPSLGEKCSIH